MSYVSNAVLELGRMLGNQLIEFVEVPLSGKRRLYDVAMRRNRLAARTKDGFEGTHLIWIPKYRGRVLVGPVAVRVRDNFGLQRSIGMFKNEIGATGGHCVF